MSRTFSVFLLAILSSLASALPFDETEIIPRVVVLPSLFCQKVDDAT